MRFFSNYHSIAPMKIIAATHSNLPRIGDKQEEQKLRRAYAKLEKKQINQDEFEDIRAELIRELISIQKSSGCGLVTDGMIRWYDHASHMAAHLSGFEINGLLRFFDTNYYFRQPIAGDNIAEGSGGLAEEAAFAVSQAGCPVKAVMLGPYSLARMSQNRTSMDFGSFCRRLADILAVEAGRLASKGIDYVQIEEPAFVREPRDFELLKDAIGRIARNKGQAKLLLTFYFGDCAAILDRLAEIDADMFGLDFSYSPGLTDRLKNYGFEKTLSLGILDGRNTKLENPDDLAGKLSGILEKLEGEECHITTSSGLEYLPRDYAIKKLELTSRVAALLNGEG